MTSPTERDDDRDLSVTALFTAEVWASHGIKGSQWFSNRQTRTVYRVVRWFLFIQRCFRWGLPRLREGLIQRHVCIDQLIFEKPAEHIVEVASGMSSRFCRVLESQDVQTYSEIDLPGMSCEKDCQLRASDGSHWLEDKRFIRLSGDVKNISTIIEQPPAGRLDVIAEGLFMYFRPSERIDIFTSIATIIKSAGEGRLIFDLLPPTEEPPPGLLGKLLAKLMRWMTRGGNFDRSPQTREDIKNDLIRSGFNEVEIICPATYTGLFPDVETRQVIFVARP